MKFWTRAGFVAFLTLVAAAGVFSHGSYSPQDEWAAVKAVLAPNSMEGTFFEGSPEEVAARIDNLALVGIDPTQRVLSYDSRGPVSISSKTYWVFSPDMNQVFGVTISCTGTCTGNGCGVSGCDIVESGCSGCTCPGCEAQCSCQKKMEFTPATDPE